MMSVETTSPVPLFQPAAAITLLAATYVSAGIILGMAYGPNGADIGIINAAFFATVFAQAGLLGILLGLGTQSNAVRVVEFVAGAAWLYVPLRPCMHLTRDVYAMTLAAATISAVVLLVAPHGGPHPNAVQ